MTFSEYLAIALLPVAFASSYRKATLPSLALLLAFIANVAYANGIVESESIRYVSAIVGLAGAIEFGAGVERTKCRKPVSIPDAFRKVDVGTWIGLVLLASMGVDGFGAIVYRKFDVWVVPETTIGILVLVIGLGLFERDER